MAWLSPSYPVGAFSYSSGIEWAVETGDITDAATLTDWLSVMMSNGGGFCDAVLFAHAHRAASDDDEVALKRCRRTGRGFLADKGTPSRNHGTGAGLHRCHPRGLGVRDAVAAGESVGWPGRLSRRRRRGLRGPWHCSGCRVAGVPSRGRGELDLGRRAVDPARADRTASVCWRHWSRSSSLQRQRRLRHRSTISAAPRSANRSGFR